MKLSIAVVAILCFAAAVPFASAQDTSDEAFDPYLGTGRHPASSRKLKMSMKAKSTKAPAKAKATKAPAKAKATKVPGKDSKATKAPTAKADKANVAVFTR